MNKLTEGSAIDGINVRATGHVEVRRMDRVLRGAVEIAKTYHRHVLAPGDDLSNEDPKVATIAQAAWTPEVIAAHERRVAELQAQFAAVPDATPTE